MVLPHITSYDFIVIIGFMLLLVITGIVFRKFSSDSANFFVGGHNMPWWIAGISAFMFGISCATFTCSAGLVHDHGLTILAFDISGIIGYLIAYMWTASRYRQIRCITYVDIIRNRFGNIVERYYAFLSIPFSIFGAAITLYTLSIFASTIMTTENFVMPAEWAIIISGMVIGAYATVGGSWAVSATGFLQALILFAVAAILSVLTIIDVGGISNFISKIPAEHWNPANKDQSWVWIIAIAIQGALLVNEAGGAGRFLMVRDGRAARKVAMVCILLSLVGTAIWYIPPMASSFLYPNLENDLQGLRLAKASEASYAVMSLRLLPVGLAGLMISAMFAATMSQMGGLINRTSGVMVMNVYKNWIRKNAGSMELLVAGKIVTVVCSILVILIAILYNSLPGLGALQVSLFIAASIILPVAIPTLLFIFIRKTPWWSPIASSVFGIIVGFLGQCGNIPKFKWIGQAFSEFVTSCHLPQCWAQVPWSIPVQIFTVIGFTGGIYVLTCFFWNWQSKSMKQQIEDFYKKMETPIGTNEIKHQQVTDNRVLIRIGILTMSTGIAIAFLIFVPGNTLRGRIATLSLTLSIIALGLILYVKGKKAETIPKKDKLQPKVEIGDSFVIAKGNGEIR